MSAQKIIYTTESLQRIGATLLQSGAIHFHSRNPET